jgi:hypothetical protein
MRLTATRYRDFISLLPSTSGSRNNVSDEEPSAGSERELRFFDLRQVIAFKEVAGHARTVYVRLHGR